jgi:hypothetical protein
MTQSGHPVLYRVNIATEGMSLKEVLYVLCHRIHDRLSASGRHSFGTVNVLELETTSAAKAVPRREIPDEVYR